MEATEYFEAVGKIIDKIIRTTEMDIYKMNEQEKQIMGAFLFWHFEWIFIKKSDKRSPNSKCYDCSVDTEVSI